MKLYADMKTKHTCCSSEASYSRHLTWKEVTETEKQEVRVSSHLGLIESVLVSAGTARLVLVLQRAVMLFILLLFSLGSVETPPRLPGIQFALSVSGEAPLFSVCIGLHLICV